MNIAKVDTEERGEGGDGFAKDKAAGQEVIRAGFYPPPPPQLPRGLGGKEMACLALKLGHEEIAL